jgi:WD40 repeat protein
VNAADNFGDTSSDGDSIAVDSVPAGMALDVQTESVPASARIARRRLRVLLLLPAAVAVGVMVSNFLPPSVDKPVRAIGPRGWVSAVAFSPDGTLLATAVPGRAVRIWAAATGHPVRTLTGNTQDVESVAWSPDGSKIASSDSESTIRIWDATTGDTIRTIHTDVATPLSVAWSPDGSKIAAGSIYNVVGIWDANTGDRIRLMSGHAAPVVSVAWSPDGSRLVSASDDGTVRVWNVADGSTDVAWAPNEVVAPADLDAGTLWLQQEWSVAWSSRGVIAVGDSDGRIRFCDADTGKIIDTITGVGHSIVSVAWSSDGTSLASASGDGTIRIWKAHTGTTIKTIHTGSGLGVWSLTWAPNGRQIASASYAGIQIWNADK